MVTTVPGGLRSNQQANQQCFIGHSQGASWRETFEQVCEDVLPNFGLQPWYADKHYQASVPLRQKVVNMIATTRYGIYDLSSWRKNDQDPWMMPRNVLIELGMAIALNRPILLLRHGKNRECGLTLPACLEGIEIGEFGDGKKMLKETLNVRLPALMQRTPQQDWLNRYCHFGGLECSYREMHPQAQQWGRQKIHIHVSDGTNAAHIDCGDFHDMIEEDVISRYNNLEFTYLDSLINPPGRKFLLCSRCQEVRSSPFAIYRITPDTSADTFIAIGMSIALEKQFGYAITKILITDDANMVPSLLKGYEIIEERDYVRIKDRLNAILPEMIEEMKQTTWKPQPLPFEVFLPEKEISTTKVVVGSGEEIVIADASLPASSEEEIDNLSPARLILHSERSEVVQEYLLDKREMSIGRAPNSDIVLTRDKLASRRHATVRHENGQYILYDERSANGTFVNGQQIEERTLQDGDHIGIGEHELVFLSFASVVNTIDKGTIKKNEPVNIFISYARNDEDFMDKLTAHLTPLQRQGLITLWDEGEIRAGMDLTSEIDRHLNAADVILLLISVDFIVSDLLDSEEMQRIMERARAGEVRVIPIILRPVDWREAPFGHLSALPADGKPISKWANQDRAFVGVVEGIRRVVEDLQNRP